MLFRCSLDSNHVSDPEYGCESDHSNHYPSLGCARLGSFPILVDLVARSLGFGDEICLSREAVL